MEQFRPHMQVIRPSCYWQFCCDVTQIKVRSEIRAEIQMGRT